MRIAGQNRHVEAGRCGDRSAEGGRPFVNEPQMIRERQNRLHSGFLPVRSNNRTAIFAADAAGGVLMPMTVCLDSTENRFAAVVSDRAWLRVGRDVLGGCLVELVAVVEDVALVPTDPVHESVHGLAQ